MTFRKDDFGQIYTTEGLAAALVMVGVLLFIMQSISLVTPQTGMTTDMKLYQKTADMLVCMDNPGGDNSSILKAAVAGWGGSPATISSVTPPGDTNISLLDTMLASNFTSNPASSDIAYELDIHYNDGTTNHDVPVIIHGKPADSSVVSSRLVTINRGDVNSTFWATKNRYPQVVEVRLSSWYL
ncbi:MAG TPA: hypothetical protein VK436_08615 [Methanocella sp.]|nr:hypothetical protein [Methanocella sp.]